MPTRSDGGRRSAAMSDLTLVPPKTTLHERAGLWNVSSCSASSPICDASSRVGETARARTPGGPEYGLRRSSTVGSRKPIVFPVPVFAFAITSNPCRITGSVCACTAVSTS